MSQDRTVLALETSCDETGVAILRGNTLLASEIASQTALHDRYGGVVPEVASRNHLVAGPALLRRALENARVDLAEVDAFAATSGPGLAGSLMIGASLAKGLALPRGKPYLAINHLEGHLLSPFFAVASASSRCSQGDRRPDADATIPANVALIVSGGHTILLQVRALGDYRLLGRTLDDAAGEAFDKVAKMLGLGYPGGPEIQRHAEAGNPDRYDLPRSMLHSRNYNFSFSGIKTAVRYLLPKLEGNYLADLCASFQAAVVEVLVAKTMAAARETRTSLVTMSGGVSCNRALRSALEQACQESGIELRVPKPELCTDNAAMIAFAAALRLQAGHLSDLTQEIDPNLALA